MRSDIKFRTLGFVAIFAFVTAACAIAIGEDEAATELEAQAQAEDSGQKEVLTTLEQRMLKRISIDFRNTPIDDVIRIMAEQADVDIVKSPQVIGNVTATLTTVPLAEALDNILAAHGYGYVASKNMIRIAPVGEIIQTAERLDSKIYHITYADVKEVEKALQKFVSKQASLSASLSTSHIIVTDTETNIKAIDTFIEEIDRITPQVLVEVRIYDITSRDTLDLGIEWHGGSNTSIGSMIGDNPTAGQTDPYEIGQFFGDTGKTASDFAAGLRFGWFDDSVDIDAVIRAQKEKADAKLLANPRILVLDNEKALFDIVTEIPYAEATFTATMVTETIKFKNVGVKLEVIPHVTRDGMLRLNITPEFSVVVREESFETSDVPVVDSRKVNTIALVEDGQTVVLGGLRQKTTSKQVNKVPLLGDLPIVGWAFRFEGEDTVNSEIVIFITPRIVIRPDMSEREIKAFEVTEFDGPEVDLTRAEEKASEEKTSEE